MIELLWIGVTTVVWGLLMIVYFMSGYNAPRIDALYTDTESEEEANNSLLRSAKSFRCAHLHRPLLPYPQASFAISICLFCHINRPLLPYPQVSFAISIGLFCHIHRSLLPYQ